MKKVQIYAVSAVLLSVLVFLVLRQLNVSMLTAYGSCNEITRICSDSVKNNYFAIVAYISCAVIFCVSILALIASLVGSLLRKFSK